MRNTRVLFAVSLFAGIGVAVGVGCGSSKSSGNNNTPVEAGPSGDDGSAEASGGPGSGCGPIGGGATTCDPGMGLTCCVDLANALNALSGGSVGVCQTAATCTMPIQYECLGMPGQCSTGQSCCGSEMGDAGALTAALADANVGDASYDAASIADIDAASITSLFAGLSFQANCATSCTAAQYTLCSSTSDCSANPGYVCAAPPASLFGGATGAASGATGGLSLSSVIMISVCQPPPAEGGTATDAGTTTTDAGTTTTDAATDAGAASDGATSG